MKSNYQTLSKLTQRVIQRLSMYQGTSVQIYAEDRIMQMILDNYNLVVDSFAWSGLSFWKEYTLAGNNGEVLEDVSKDITSFGDILAIVPKDDDSYSLKRLHTSTPVTEITGTAPVYYKHNTNNTDKVFQVVPYNSVGKILVHAKGKLKTNDTIIPKTIIPFDSDYLVYAVCVDYLADDDNSRTQLEKFTQLRDGRLSQLKAIDNAGTTDYNDEVSLTSVNVWR